MIRRVIGWGLAAVLGIAIAVGIAFEVSPWPQALLIRHAFQTDADATSAALAKHVPPGVAEKVDIAYGDGPDAYLDAFFPASAANGEAVLPTVVWIHGGAWISGTRKNVANYLRILAAHGYTTVGIDYSVAPEATYPTPLRQVSAALAYLRDKGTPLHVDATRIVLAGDSAGAQIAAQVANLLTDLAYSKAIGIDPTLPAASLKGVILDCGAYDATSLNFEGPFGSFLRTVLWSYSGSRDYKSVPGFETASVLHYVTAAFPPVFISGGNGDPLTPQSRAMAEALGKVGVSVDTLFFPTDTSPPLPHEYQFNLDTAAGNQALDRTLAFLARVLGAAGA